jgi:DNA mismatch repair protein MutH
MEEKGRQLTKDDILAIGKGIIGKTFNELGYRQWAQTATKKKGGPGNFVEEVVFGYKANNDPHADFKEAGIELKVTGVRFRESKQTWTAKERLVICMINYMHDYLESFYQSHMWEKSRKIYAVFYEYNDETNFDYGSFRIVDARLLSFSEEDLAIIEGDYESIIKKIKGGLANTISEGDTNYLAACTKAENAEKGWTGQPFSSIPAKRRAWSYKSSFMTLKVNEWFGGKIHEPIIKNPDEIRQYSLTGAITRKVAPYIGLTRTKLLDKFQISGDSKQINWLLLNKMLGISGVKDAYNEIDAADIEIKTMTLEPNGVPQEHMSFNYFDFKDIIRTPFEESDIFDHLSRHSFLFVLWKKTGRGKKQEEVFEGLRFWKMPYSDLEKYRSIYEATVNVLKTGHIFSIDGKGHLRNNFPKPGFNGIGHVRPHAKNGQDICHFPFPDLLTGKTGTTKQCFWLDKDYLWKIIKEGR